MNSPSISDRSWPRKRADTVIVGAGIAGWATAFCLAKRGQQIIVLDKGTSGFEQSTRNWGWVHSQIRHPHLIPLAQFSIRYWQRLESELESELGWQQGGSITLVKGDHRVQELELWREDALALGLDSSIISSNGVEQHAPGVSGNWSGGLYIPIDGQADPHRVIASYKNAAVRLGVGIEEQCSVLGFDLMGGRVNGVITERGRIGADNVVCAAGSWSSRLLRSAGVRLPQRSLRCTVVRTAPAPSLTRTTIASDSVSIRQDDIGRFVLGGSGVAVYDLDCEALNDLRYFIKPSWINRKWIRPAVGRRLLADIKAQIPGLSSSADFWSERRVVEPKPHAGTVTANINAFRRLLPQHAELPVEATWAGQLDMTPDYAPVIGPVTELAGLYLCTGFSGHGFTLAPGAAHLLSELILGDRPSLDIHQYRLNRFRENDLPQVRWGR